MINSNGEKPNPIGIKPIKIEIIDANKAYGNCVLTWLKGSISHAKDEIMVVSLNGEQWSPKTAPLKTAAMLGAMYVELIFSLNPKIIGRVNGINSPIVPHDVPVKKESIDPIRNRYVGNKFILIFSKKESSITSWMFNDLKILLRSQALKRIATGLISFLKPTPITFNNLSCCSWIDL